MTFAVTVHELAAASNVGSSTKAIPIWGTTDTHNHALANLSFGGHLLWGDVSDSLADVYDCRHELGDRLARAALLDQRVGHAPARAPVVAEMAEHRGNGAAQPGHTPRRIR